MVLEPETTNIGYLDPAGKLFLGARELDSQEVPCQSVSRLHGLSLCAGTGMMAHPSETHKGLFQRGYRAI